MNDLEIINIFIEEATDLLTTWEKECLRLEKEKENHEFAALFRCAHNLKGSSKSVGLEDFGTFVHGVEDVISLLDHGKIKLIPQLVEYLLECQSIMMDWIQGIKGDLTYHPDYKIVQKKTAAIKGFAEKKDTVSEEELIKDFGTLAIEMGKATPTQVEKAAEIQKRKIGEIMVDEGILTPETVNTILEKQNKQKEKLGIKKADEAIRISARKIDHLIQLIGELSIHQSIIAHSQKTNQLNSMACYNAINLASKINSEIQSHAMALRMLPLEGLFQRLERIILDIARTENKKVEVVLKGSDVELDKTIIEKITDAMIHIVRNSIDHGVESSEKRLAAGKKEIATIQIEAEQDATGITITVSDDGKGLDVDAVRKKAIEKQLIDENHRLSDTEIRNLIMSPGFSTAEKVTDISGRGVGLDVVKKTVTDVNGVVDILGKKGEGAKFSIKLPTTLSIIDSIVVGVDGNRYIIPLFELTEIIDLEAYQQGKTSTGETMINLRGRVVPVEHLRRYFPLKRAEKNSATKNGESRQRPALILDIENNKMAFEVDEIFAQQQIVMRSLNHQLAEIPGYSGGSIMENGEVGMIVELKKIALQYNNKFSNKDNF